MARKLIEKRRRGFFGWLFLLMFWGWNVLMAFALFAGLDKNVQHYGKLATEAERQGYAAGTGIGVMLILIAWAAGAVILGLIAYFTRGRRELIEIDS